MRRRVRWVLAPAMIGLVGIAGAACSSSSSGSAAAASSAGNGTSASASSTGASPRAAAANAECAASKAPVTALEPQSSTDPIIGIPVPEGWVRETSLDSQMIRGGFGKVNPDEPGASATAMVVVEDLTGRVPSAEAGIQAEIDGVTMMGGEVLEQQSLTVCGFPAGLAQVRLPVMGAVPEREGTVLAVITESDGAMIATVVTIQNLVADNPTYDADRRTIVDGMQITAQPIQG